MLKCQINFTVSSLVLMFLGVSLAFYKNIVVGLRSEAFVDSHIHVFPLAFRARFEAHFMTGPPTRQTYNKLRFFLRRLTIDDACRSVGK